MKMMHRLYSWGGVDNNTFYSDQKLMDDPKPNCDADLEAMDKFFANRKALLEKFIPMALNTDKESVDKLQKNFDAVVNKIQDKKIVQKIRDLFALCRKNILDRSTLAKEELAAINKAIDAMKAADSCEKAQMIWNTMQAERMPILIKMGQLIGEFNNALSDIIDLLNK
jgi:hypothetical protein